MALPALAVAEVESAAPLRPSMTGYAIPGRRRRLSRRSRKPDAVALADINHKNNPNQ
jgi:hypothetical protein